MFVCLSDRQMLFWEHSETSANSSTRWIYFRDGFTFTLKIPKYKKGRLTPLFVFICKYTQFFKLLHNLISNYLLEEKLLRQR